MINNVSMYDCVITVLERYESEFKIRLQSNKYERIMNMQM